MDFITLLKASSKNEFEFYEKRPGIAQVLTPFFYPDGDMMNIFIEKTDDISQLRVCDYGETLMHLSYSFDFNTDNKLRILNDIVTENYGQIDNGNIYIDTSIKNLYIAIMRFSQIISKVSNMSILKHSNVKSLFYEYLAEFIEASLKEYNPKRGITPIIGRTDLVVDYSFAISDKKPIYLFGIKDSSKAKETTICCLEFLRLGISFKSLMVYENQENVSKKDRDRLTDIADKQFTELASFKELAPQYFFREAV